MKRYTRVRYKKDNDKYISDTFIGKQAQVLQGIIQTDIKVATICVVKSTGLHPVKAISYTNLSKVKKQIKELLKGYGVVFYDEVRRYK